MAKSVKVWSKFSVTNDTGTMKFNIVDMPQDRFEDLADLIIEYYVKEEVTYKVIGVAADEEALLEYRGYVEELMPDASYHVSVCCIDNDDDEIGDIIGASILLLSTNEDTIESKVQVKAKTIYASIQLSKTMDSYYNPKKIHNLEKYYEDRGLVVHPKYRGNGIAQEFLKVRRLICKEHGVPMTGAWMTAYGTQKAAKRDGWEIKYELDNEILGKKFDVTFDSASPPTSLFMIAKI